MICGLVTRTPAVAEAVDTDEAHRGEHGQDAAGDAGPETPAEICIVLTRCRLGAVITASETAERRQRGRL